MKPGFVRCPLCRRALKLWPNGLMPPHMATFYRQGAGIAGTANSCKGGRKRPQDVEES